MIGTSRINLSLVVTGFFILLVTILILIGSQGVNAGQIQGGCGLSCPISQPVSQPISSSSSLNISLGSYLSTGNTVVMGQEFEYTIFLFHLGQATAVDGIQVELVLPDNLEYQYTVADASIGSSVFSDGVFVWDVGSIQTYDRPQLSIGVKVVGGQVGQEFLTEATVLQAEDGVIGFSSHSLYLGDEAQADLSVMMMVLGDPKSVTPGEEFRVVLNPYNYGPQPMEDISLLVEYDQRYLEIVGSNVSRGSFDETTAVWSLPLIEVGVGFEPQELSYVDFKVKQQDASVLTSVVLSLVGSTPVDSWADNNQARYELWVQGELPVDPITICSYSFGRGELNFPEWCQQMERQESFVIETTADSDAFLQRIIIRRGTEFEYFIFPETPFVVDNIVDDMSFYTYFERTTPEALAFSTDRLTFSRQGDEVVERQITVWNPTSEYYALNGLLTDDTHFEVQAEGEGECVYVFENVLSQIAPGQECVFTITSTQGDIEGQQVFFDFYLFPFMAEHDPSFDTVSVDLVNEVREAVEEFQITIEHSDLGTAFPLHQQIVYEGSDLTISFFPETQEYEVTGLIIDGQAVDFERGITSYTFEEVTADHSLLVLFGDYDLYLEDPVDFTWSDRGVAQTGQEISFVALTQTHDSNPSWSTWHWDFGDGTTSFVHDPEHVYNTPGVYVVTLWVDGRDWSDAISYEITVVEASDPLAEVVADEVIEIATDYETELVLPVDDERISEIILWLGQTTESASLIVSGQDCQSNHDNELLCVEIDSTGVNESLNQAWVSLRVPQVSGVALEDLVAYHRLPESDDWQPISWRVLETQAGYWVIEVETDSLGQLLVSHGQLTMVAGQVDSQVAASGSSITTVALPLSLVSSLYFLLLVGLGKVRLSKKTL